jgi:hypothetical protein
MESEDVVSRDILRAENLEAKGNKGNVRKSASRPPERDNAVTVTDRTLVPLARREANVVGRTHGIRDEWHRVQCDMHKSLRRC